VTGPKPRYVDPHTPRGPLYRAIRRLSTTHVGVCLSVDFAWELDPHLLNLTRGRFSPVRTLSRGRRSGAASGTLPAASTAISPTSASRPGKLDASFQSFSWFLVSGCSCGPIPTQGMTTAPARSGPLEAKTLQEEQARMLAVLVFDERRAGAADSSSLGLAGGTSRPDPCLPARC
jgi:hypothetical protein